MLHGALELSDRAGLSGRDSRRVEDVFDLYAKGFGHCGKDVRAWRLLGGFPVGDARLGYFQFSRQLGLAESSCLSESSEMSALLGARLGDWATHLRIIRGEFHRLVFLIENWLAR